MSRRRRDVIDIFEADDGRGVWSISEHSRWRRQWRAVRRLPIILQILLLLAWLELVATGTFVAWLVVGGLTMPPP